MVSLVRKLMAILLAFVIHFVPQKVTSVEIWSSLTLVLCPWYFLNTQLPGHYNNKESRFSQIRWNWKYIEGCGRIVQMSPKFLWNINSTLSNVLEVQVSDLNVIFTHCKYFAMVRHFLIYKALPHMFSDSHHTYLIRWTRNALASPFHR